MNFGQSSNDVIPTAMHVAAACMLDASLRLRPDEGIEGSIDLDGLTLTLPGAVQEVGKAVGRRAEVTDTVAAG